MLTQIHPKIIVETMDLHRNVDGITYLDVSPKGIYGKPQYLKRMVEHYKTMVEEWKQEYPFDQYKIEMFEDIIKIVEEENEEYIQTLKA